MSTSVRRRLLLSQLLPMVPAAIVGLVCVAGLMRVAWVAHEARTTGVRRMQVIDEAVDLFREEVVLLERYRQQGDPALVSASRARSLEVHERVDALSQDELRLVLPAQREGEDLSVLLGDFELLAGLTGPPGDPDEVDRAARHVLRVMAERTARYQGRVQSDLRDVADTARMTAVGVVVIVGSLIILGSLGSLGLSRALVRDLDALERGTEALAAGDFEHRIVLAPAPEERSDELVRLASAFNRMAERIGQLDRMREDFFANLSHDLKTPLTSMLEAVDLLDEEVAGPLSADQRRLVTVAQDGGRRLRGLVENILEFSRQRARNDVLRPGDPVQATDKAMDELALQARRRGLHLSRGGDPALPLVLLSRAMLDQVLLNLLDNAIKHASRGGEVKVRLARVDDPLIREQSGVAAVRFDVQDDGPGIPAQYRERVFERFFQAPGERSGTGLGLHICHRIVESHGGRLWVEDVPGGACLSFVLPVVEVAHG